MDTSQRPPLRIGPLTLETPILLAPMAGYTDLPFRMVIRPLGGLGLAYTEMVNPYSVLFGKGGRRTAILATSPEDRPLAHQIYGSDPNLLATAARWLQDHGAEMVDINMGCPSREITSSGGGAALLRSPVIAVQLAESVVSAVTIPVSVKLRLGWDADEVVAPDLAREVEGIGVSAITVHGRTRAQGFGGETSLEGIRRVVEAVEQIPVFGNGDIASPEDGMRMMAETGCAGIMVGRGATRNPWLIRDLWRAVQGLPELPPPTEEERLSLLREQFEHSVRHYGEAYAVPIFRRWIAERARHLGWSREVMLRHLRIPDIAGIRAALAVPREAVSL